MANIRARKENNKLFFDFSYKGKRCREQTTLPDSLANRKRMKKVLANIEAEITLNTFNYATYFPDSKMVAIFDEQLQAKAKQEGDVPCFEDFAKQWLLEMKIEWRTTHYKTVDQILRKYLIPYFGDKKLTAINRDDIFAFRASLATVPGRKGEMLSPSRINHIMDPVRMILAEGAMRYKYVTPYQKIKNLKVPRTDVKPFSLEEVKLIIDKVRKDYRNYFIVRFFTGLRSSEIHGLRWQDVDFDRRLIAVRKALVDNKMIDVKTDGSFRDIEMSGPVHEALQQQQQATGNLEFVFTTTVGTPLSTTNVTKRVWYPLLRHLKLKQRRPYQTRHTAATLWLASGETPEWIARQMGHTTTTMLFRVYSRFVPNITQADGSAFERLLKKNF